MSYISECPGREEYSKVILSAASHGPDAGFLRGERVLITGATGMLGGALARTLLYLNRTLDHIDYCLAQTVALEFWAMIQKDRDSAWKHYMAYTKQGGSRTFTDLIKNAGLTTPFDENCLRGVCETATEWLNAFDMTGIE